MAKITLDNITSGFASNTLFNTNFDAIETELNDKVLYRNNPAGEANQMLNDLDMNSNDILNTGTVNTTSLVLNGTTVSPTAVATQEALNVNYDNSTSGLTAVNVQAAIDEIAPAQTLGNNFGKNLIINGDFSVWQRGTSQTSSGYGSDDRFSNENVGSTKTASRQTWALGDSDNINNNKYFSRTVVTSSAGAGNYVVKTHKLESVTRTAGKEITISFRAKADASKNIALEFVQNFGTGGSPSSAVTAIDVTTFALTTSWQTFTVTITPPSVSGKTLGTNSNDSLNLNFWFEAGSSLDARTNTLGQQSGTFDLDSLQLEFGDTATDFEYVDPATQLSRCQRYFRQLTDTPPTLSDDPLPLGAGACFDTSNCYFTVDVSDMRAEPTLSISSAAHFDVYEAGSAHSASAIIINRGSSKCVEIAATASGAFVAGNAAWLRMNTTSASMALTSEL